jgi:hypothetical protein
MNIKHEGKTYEVLTLDRISEITHAKLVGGKVVIARCLRGFTHIYTIEDDVEAVTTFVEPELVDYGIIPLRLVPKEPVTFDRDVLPGFGGTRYIGVPADVPVGKRFRCVEIVEEGA